MISPMLWLDDGMSNCWDGDADSGFGDDSVVDIEGGDAAALTGTAESVLKYLSSAAGAHFPLQKPGYPEVAVKCLQLIDCKGKTQAA